MCRRDAEQRLDVSRAGGPRRRRPHGARLSSPPRVITRPAKNGRAVSSAVKWKSTAGAWTAPPSCIPARPSSGIVRHGTKTTSRPTSPSFTKTMRSSRSTSRRAADDAGRRLPQSHVAGADAREVSRGEPAASPWPSHVRTGVVRAHARGGLGAGAGVARSRRSRKPIARSALGETRTEMFVIDVPIGPVPHPLLGTVQAASRGRQAVTQRGGGARRRPRSHVVQRRHHHRAPAPGAHSSRLCRASARRRSALRGGRRAEASSGTARRRRLSPARRATAVCASRHRRAHDAGRASAAGVADRDKKRARAPRTRGSRADRGVSVKSRNPSPSSPARHVASGTSSSGERTPGSWSTTGVILAELAARIDADATGAAPASSASSFAPSHDSSSIGGRTVTNRASPPRAMNSCASSSVDSPQSGITAVSPLRAQTRSFHSRWVSPMMSPKITCVTSCCLSLREQARCIDRCRSATSTARCRREDPAARPARESRQVCRPCDRLRVPSSPNIVTMATMSYVSAARIKRQAAVLAAAPRNGCARPAHDWVRPRIVRLHQTTKPVTNSTAGMSPNHEPDDANRQTAEAADVERRHPAHDRVAHRAGRDVCATTARPRSDRDRPNQVLRPPASGCGPRTSPGRTRDRQTATPPARRARRDARVARCAIISRHDGGVAPALGAAATPVRDSASAATPTRSSDRAVGREARNRAR